ncbi:MAG: tRNA (adenosine(37)-N6)-dimethylallyltransferase MiaA [Candidatus Omnitrophica bacterium]|nr:tRNA (adenosine(37)-N6)-dimethylallyltransferase MiaA [Candidatus Omnitrophota bacterium]
MSCALPRIPIVFLVGPTAVGKTAVAIELACQMNGEVVSCDAMQVYREAMITTDRPSQDMLKGVPHHVMGIVSVEEEFNVALYREVALKAIKDILARQKTPIICGGSGMYMMALLDGLLEGGAPDAEVRRHLEAEADKLGLKVLYRRLQEVDPQAAEKITSADRVRIVRALEVFESTGVPISMLQKTREGLWGRYHIRIFCLNREREELYARAEARIDQMFALGLEGEVKALLKHALTPTSSRIIGIPELRDYFSGVRSLGEAKELMKRNTRHYIKRQLTWFRKDKRLEWINAAPDASVVGVVEDIRRLM